MSGWSVARIEASHGQRSRLYAMWQRAPTACIVSLNRVVILLLLAGCGTTALKPEPKLVSSVTSLPPVDIPISVRCVKDVTGPDAARFTNGIPNIPNVAIAPNATPLQRYYQMKEALLAAEQYVLDANGVILACAAKETK